MITLRCRTKISSYSRVPRVFHAPETLHIENGQRESLKLAVKDGDVVMFSVCRKRQILNLSDNKEIIVPCNNLLQ